MKLIPATRETKPKEKKIRIPTFEPGFSYREPLVLDFDIENRPLSYLGSDFTTAEITAIAASFVGEDKVHVWALGEVTSEDMLRGFIELYNKADIVTGHYIRKHDLPIINGALMEFGLPKLGEKRTHDTKLDLIKALGISKSQENLSEMWELQESKYHMSQIKWRKANRLTPEGIEQTKKRVIDDVNQHKALRELLLENDYLGPVVMWR